jgi:3-phenylpropionate/trans-cinnamate dioxygenase ferredoxin subunit
VSAPETRVLAVADLPVGQARRVEVGGRALCVAHAEDGCFYAVDDRCTHEDSPLSDGWVDGTDIECPRHNAIFDLRTGNAETLPAVEPVATHQVTVRDGQILVRLGAPDPESGNGVRDIDQPARSGGHGSG